MNTIAIIICAIFLAGIKKGIKAWDGENEGDYEKIDKKLSVVSVLINIVFILSYFFFGAGFEYVLGVKEYDAIAMLCYFIGFVIALGANMIIQARVVNLYKEMNPEKQGSVYAFDFSKKWEQSSDEAERIKIYKAAFKSYNFCSTFYIFLWLCCLLGNQIWHYGIMPATIVIIVWLVQFISYQSYAAYYSKNSKSEKVEIDYVEKKHVKKPNGGKPGFVVYYTNYSLMIDSDISEIRLVE